MANNKNLLKGKDTQFSNRSSERAATEGRKGGIVSGQSRRLNKRLANLTKYTDRQSLTKHKRKLKKLWKVRRGFIRDDGKLIEVEEVRGEIREVIENMRIIKDCGSDVLNIVAIANSPHLAAFKPEVVIKAQAELWDRGEGKSLAKTENKEVKEFSDEVEYLD